MHSKNLTTRLLTAALFFVLAGFAACGLAVDDATRIERATEYRANGDYRAAVIELKNVLENDPRNVEARALLGDVQLSLGDAASAEKELKRARDLGADDDEVALGLGTALLAQAKYDEALALLQPLQLDTSQGRAASLALQGHAKLGQDQLVEGRELFERARAEDPQSIEALLGLASAARRNGDLDTAEQRILEARAIDAESVDVLNALGNLMLQSQRYVEAEEAFLAARALQGMPNTTRAMILAGLIESQIGQRKFDLANTTADRLLEIAPAHPVSGFLRARVAFDQGRYDEAILFLQKSLSRHADYGPAQLLMGASQLATNEFIQAEMHLKAVLAKQPGNVMARKLLATARLKMNQPAAAVETLRASADSEDSGLLAMIGQANLQLGEIDAAVAYYEQSVAKNPNDPKVKMELVTAYLAAGQAEKALPVLDQLEAVPEFTERTQMLRVIVELRQGEVESARSQLESLLVNNPGNALLRTLAGSFYDSQGDPARARENYEAAVAVEPGNLLAVLNLSRLDIIAENFPAASGRLERYLQLDPGNLAAMMALSQLHELSGNRERAVSTLQSAQQKNPNSVEPSLVLARYHLANKDPQEALKVAEQIVQRAPDSGAAHNAYGVALMATGELALALQSFERAAALAPESRAAHFNAARAQLSRGMNEQAKQSLERALRIQPDYFPAAAALAKLEAQANNFARAADLVKQMKALFPAEAPPLILAGDIQMARRQPELAIEEYAAAEKLAWTQGLAVKQFRARQAAGQADATSTLVRWLDANRDDFVVRMVLAQAYQARGDDKGAIGQYELVIAGQPTNAIALNNLAWIYSQQGTADDTRRALEAASKAAEIAPNAPAIIDTYGWLLVQQGDLSDGMDLLKRASAVGKGDPDIDYHYAFALNKTGDSATARGLLERALEAHPSFASRGDAQELLVSLGGG